jgi:predicted esterase
MSYPAVRIPAKKVHTASVIFLHGLGDSGYGWSFLSDEAARSNKLQHVKFIFPHAPQQPVTLNMGMKMPSWYDIRELSSIQAQQDEPGVLKSIDRLKQIIAEEVQAGIPTDRIIIGGFSQGCAVSLATSAVFDKPLAGVIGLSGYLPVKDTIISYSVDNKFDTINKKTPYFLGHGTSDPVVQFQYGKLSRDTLINQLGRENVSWNEYPGMEHSVCPEELDAILKFAEKVLPEKTETA